MSDITKISEQRTKDGGDWDEWPYPTINITSRVTGDLRAKILARLDRTNGDVELQELEVSGGYSEYTQENDYEIRVLVDGRERWGSKYGTSAEDSMAMFLKWVEGNHEA